MRRCLLLILWALIFALSPTAALADGFILPEIPGVSLYQSYRIDFHEVQITITDGVARVDIDQSFTNLLATPLEVSYLFPLPESSVIDQFSLVIDGRETKAALYDRQEARRIYEEIVRARRDPALLEYAGRGLYRTSVFPIPPHGSRRLKVSYHQILSPQADLYRLVYPLATEKYSAHPLGRLSVTVRVDSAKRPLTNFYSPTHPFTVVSRSSRQLTAVYKAENVRPRNDLTIYYQLGTGQDFESTIMAYRPSGEDGYFLLLTSPRAELPPAAVQPKTILFVLDRSGSMSGTKLAQAKEALRTILPNLGPKDRFNLIAYNDQISAFKDSPAAADPATIGEALSFVDRLTALGSTDIQAALAEALRQTRGEPEGRTRYLIFLTDGQPTSGLLEPAAIRQAILAKNKDAARLFVFGVGYDVNTVLLDGLAGDNRGLTSYVRPDEDLEAAIAGLYRQIQNPVLSDLKLTCRGAELLDYYPRELPDLYYGQLLVLAGRYRGSGPVELTLSGQAGKNHLRFTYQAELPSVTPGIETSFVAHLWAARKIGYLLDYLRQLPPDSPGRQELIDEVIRLAKTYGIATEYTSFLVTEPDAERAQEQLMYKMAAPVSGAAAVGSAQANKGLQGMDQLNDEAAPAWAGETVKTSGDKTFYLRDGIWIDAAYQEGAKIIEIKAYGGEYFALVQELGARAAYLSVAERMILVWQGKTYRIVPEE